MAIESVINHNILHSYLGYSLRVQRERERGNKMQKHGFASKRNVLPYQTARLRDHYVLGKKLGQGQFGTTYLCTHKVTGKLYACKSIPKRKLMCQEDYDDVWRVSFETSTSSSILSLFLIQMDRTFIFLVKGLLLCRRIYCTEGYSACSSLPKLSGA